MSRSWGHEIRLLTDDEFDLYQRHGWKCSSRNCNEAATHATGYRYVTGRAGRVSSAERRVCPTHAAAFAKKHELAMPDAPERRASRTGYMAVDDALTSLGRSSDNG